MKVANILGKVIVGYVAVAIIALIGVNLVGAMQHEITDEDIMERYICEEFGDSCYGEIYEGNEGYVCFMVYDEDDDLVSCAGLLRDYYQHQYKE